MFPLWSYGSYSVETVLSCNPTIWLPIVNVTKGETVFEILLMLLFVLVSILWALLKDAGFTMEQAL